jgi:hypothetical protein
MGGRVVEGSGLENRQGLAPLVGSNPTPSASIASNALILLSLVETIRTSPQSSLQSGAMLDRACSGAGASNGRRQARSARRTSGSEAP